MNKTSTEQSFEPPEFRNLDFDLRSEHDLAPLGAYFDEHASLLYCGPFMDIHGLTAEPMIGGHPGVSAEACTQELLDTIEALPKDLRALLTSARERIFDYGLASGHGSQRCHIELPPAQLARMAALNLSLRVTLYPHFDEDENA